MAVHQTIDVTLMERAFIKKYEQLPLLWKKDHCDYSNKFKRNLAYDILLPILRKLIPNANRYSVRQKINILRSTYRKEVRRYQASKTITADGEIVYTYIPPSWKFEAMKFLMDQNLSDTKMEIPQSEIEEETVVEDDTYNDLEEQELVFIQEVETESGNEEHEIVMSQNPMSNLYEEQKPIVKNSHKRNKYNINDEIMAKYNERSILDRECSAVGSNVSCKLQRMDIDQRLFAEQLINKVLMRGLHKTLTAMIELSDSANYETKGEVDS